MLGRCCVVMVCAAFLTGCFHARTAQAPLPSTYPLSHQQKMQAAHHWNVLAAHQARQIVDNTFARFQPLHIRQADGEPTPFSEAYESLLASQLVGRGARVTTSGDSAFQLTYKVQVVTHEDRGFMREAEGAWTTLATGIAVATLPFTHWREPALALIPSAAAVDLFSGGWVSRSQREVIITTQVTDGDHMVYSSSHIYYINGGDDDHYRPAQPLRLSDKW